MNNYVSELSDEWLTNKVKDQHKRHDEQHPQERVEPIACSVFSEEPQAPPVPVPALSAPTELAPVMTAPPPPVVIPEPAEQMKPQGPH